MTATPRGRRVDARRRTFVAFVPDPFWGLAPLCELLGSGPVVRVVGGAQCEAPVAVRGVVRRHRGSESWWAPRGAVGHPPAPAGRGGPVRRDVVALNGPTVVLPGHTHCGGPVGRRACRAKEAHARHAKRTTKQRSEPPRARADDPGRIEAPPRLLSSVPTDHASQHDQRCALNTTNNTHHGVRPRNGLATNATDLQRTQQKRDGALPLSRRHTPL